MVTWSHVCQELLTVLDGEKPTSKELPFLVNVEVVLLVGIPLSWFGGSIGIKTNQE